MAIKPAWIVCKMDGNVTYNEEGTEPEEFKTEAAALKRAKQLVRGEEEEVWVFRLTHVVSRPDAEPDVELVK